ncbi:MAG: hypothetical protein IT424_11750 [Pirellulales bacterium]|nr:hypothetical protein [Pirellulales bacterium]
MRIFHRQRPTGRLLAAAISLAAMSIGCAAPLTGALVPAAREAPSAIEPHLAASDSAVPAPTEVALRKARAAPVPSQEQALASVLDQLEEIRAIDPEAQRELMVELKQVKPEDYPLVVDAFRTALAYRQQLAARQTQVAGSGPNPDPARAALELREAAPQAAAAAPRVPPPSPARMARPDRPIRAGDLNASAPQVARPSPHSPVQTASYEAGPQHPQPSAAANAAQQAQPPAEVAPADLAPPAVAFDEPLTPALPLASYTSSAPLPSADDWRTQLDTTIADLERTVAARPTSVAELHDHMRLRTLQLLAGQEEAAYRPIPGASPAQQDYWSKQLFAMGAYLDAGQLDDKQRAVAALGSLDEARAKLAELAALQIRNLAFVESVDGFGAYVPRKEARFAPGQKATVYAEIDNFASNSAEDGYHASLGTSYQVLDKTGRRIDGKQFPDVEDACRNRRRDFHMQYQFALPTKIYPGPYDLEITITDHNSGKIAQATVPFEIAGEP